MGKQKRFYINIWNDCNLRCRHCFNESGKTPGRVLSYSQIMRLVDEAIETVKIDDVQLTGGEPTLRPDIFRIIESLQQRGLGVLLQTNGVFEKEILEQILDIQRENFSMIISLDGLEANDFFRGSDSTKKTLENIKILASHFPIRINTLLSSLIKWDEIERIAETALRYDLVLAFNPVMPAGRAKQNFMMKPEVYFDWMLRLEDLRDRGVKVRKCFDLKNGAMIENEDCPVRKSDTVHIDADGQTYPCGFMVRFPSLNLGSVENHTITELAERIPLECKTIISECMDCDYYTRSQCHAGCPARIYGLHARFDRKEIYCMAEYFRKASE